MSENWRIGLSVALCVTWPYLYDLARHLVHG